MLPSCLGQVVFGFGTGARRLRRVGIVASVKGNEFYEKCLHPEPAREDDTIGKEYSFRELYLIGPLQMEWRRTIRIDRSCVDCVRLCSCRGLLMCQAVIER